MNAQRKTVIVTGGAGYIGSHACKALAKAGYTPVTYDNLQRGHEWAVKWGPLEKGDLLDATRLSEVFEKHEPSAVMHFAALAYVGESVEKPELYWRNNVEGSRNLIEALNRYDVSRLVFSSTCATYGEPGEIPITEACAQAPINPYGETKLEIEKLLMAEAKGGDLHSISLRYFNASGADPDGEVGEDHNPETHLIPNVLRAATGQIDKLQIYGNDYPTEDGTCIRDYIHVTDLAQAHILALGLLEQGHATSFYNLSNDQGYSVLQVIRTAEEITGKRVPREFVPRRPGDPPVLLGDSSRFRQASGWKPRFEDLSSILKTAWNWHRASLKESL